MSQTNQQQIQKLWDKITLNSHLRACGSDKFYLHEDNDVIDGGLCQLTHINGLAFDGQNTDPIVAIHDELPNELAQALAALKGLYPAVQKAHDISPNLPIVDHDVHAMYLEDHGRPVDWPALAKTLHTQRKAYRAKMVAINDQETKFNLIADNLQHLSHENSHELPNPMDLGSTQPPTEQA
jgi:hypothetical protein